MISFSLCASIEKSGFQLEVKLEKTVIKNGELLDEYIYSIRKTKTE